MLHTSKMAEHLIIPFLCIRHLDGLHAGTAGRVFTSQLRGTQAHVTVCENYRDDVMAPEFFGDFWGSGLKT